MVGEPEDSHTQLVRGIFKEWTNQEPYINGISPESSVDEVQSVWGLGKVGATRRNQASHHVRIHREEASSVYATSDI